MTDPCTAAIEAFHNAPGNTSDGVRAACAAYLAALPQMQPSDAEVERAFDTFWLHLPNDSGDEEACHRAMRAALATLPALPTPDAAAQWAEGFAEGRDAAWTLADRMWPEAHDLLDAIAALRAPEPKEPT